MVVLALDLTRAAQDPKTLQAFIQWAEVIIATCPAEIQEQLSSAISLLKDGVSLIGQIYKAPLHPMIHRPGLILTGYVTASLNLLEHAAWSWTQKVDTREVDVEVLRRWVLEEGFKAALEEVQCTTESGTAKVEMDRQIAFSACLSRTDKAKL